MSDFGEMFRALAPIIIPILVVVAIIIFFLLAIAVIVIVTLRKYKRLKAEYSEVARQTGWTYSDKMPESMRTYTQFTEQQMPPRYMTFKLAEHFLSGTKGNAAFTTFNVNFTIRVSYRYRKQSHYNWRDAYPKRSDPAAVLVREA